MRIGINILFLIPGKIGGTEIYTRALIAALARNDVSNEYFVYRNRETEANIVPKVATFHDRPQPIRATSRPLRITYEQLVLPFELARDRIDVVLNCGITAPIMATCPMITVFYDVQYTRFGHYLGKFELLITRLLFSASARRSTRLVSMTQAAETELIATYPSVRGKTFVIPHGIESEFCDIAEQRARLANTRTQRAFPFVLAVSSLMAHKNFETLLHAFVHVHATRPSLRLIIVGLRGTRADILEKLCDVLDLREVVHFTGWIPRGDVYNLFRDADAFVFSSRYEGFGIPVLEAMTAGIPIACSDIPALREIAGEAASYFDPDSAESIAIALELLLDDDLVRERSTSLGIRRARDFDWDRNIEPLIVSLSTIAKPHV